MTAAAARKQRTLLPPPVRARTASILTFSICFQAVKNDPSSLY